MESILISAYRTDFEFIIFQFHCNYLVIHKMPFFSHKSD
jgi:hypothetical protein